MNWLRRIRYRRLRAAVAEWIFAAAMLGPYHPRTQELKQRAWDADSRVARYEGRPKVKTYL